MILKPALSKVTPCRAGRCDGSALLLVLWALLLLSAAVFAWAKLIDQGIETTRQANFGLDARALARSGMRVALHPRVSRQTPLLRADFGPARGYKVKMTGEGGRLNLNWLLQGCEQDPAKRKVLEAYLTLRGLTYKERAVLIDCLLDWIQPLDPKHTGFHRLNGAADSPDYQNGHRPFLNLDEVEKVKGSFPLISKPGWKDDFTLHTQGPVDLLAAEPIVMESIPGLDAARVARFLEIRRGPDRLDGTADDYLFKDISTVRSFLGLSDSQFQALNGLVTINDPTYHIVSVGHSANVLRQVEVVTRKSGQSPAILYWKEF
jgi:type II secretory pathway component PulK